MKVIKKQSKFQVLNTFNPKEIASKAVFYLFQ